MSNTSEEKTVDQLVERTVETWSAQLGELTWHAITLDHTIKDMSIAHFESIRGALESHLPQAVTHQLKYLELGTYAHYTGQLLTRHLGIESTLTDISPHTLRLGQKAAGEDDVSEQATLVACDYHDLPFNDATYDIVFIASAIHHTLTPEVVLKECLRVLAPGGLFIMENEPCTRNLGFYKFVSNRDESFTPIEKELSTRGLLRTVSSPFYGARPEQLFGMVENDRIPIDLYWKTISDKAEIVDSRIDYQCCMSELDAEILAKKEMPDTELKQFIINRLSMQFNELKPKISEKENLLGFSLPSSAEIETVSDLVAGNLNDLAKTTDPHQQEMLKANIFGAALRLVARKHGAKSETQTDSVAADLPGESKFSRAMTLEDGVWRENLESTGIEVQISNSVFPDIQTADQSQIETFADPAHWAYYKEENGFITLVNLTSSAELEIPGREIPYKILLSRFHAVEQADQPYYIEIAVDGEKIEQMVVCQSESRFLRAVIKGPNRRLTFRTTDRNGEEIDLPYHLRIGILHLIPMVAKA